MRPAPLLLLALGLVSCSQQDAGSPVPPLPDARLQVYVVNEPLRYFAQRIGGDAVEVHFPAPNHVDPATWSPNAETIAAYQSADVILLNGASYAAWVARATLPRHALVDTCALGADRLVTQTGGVIHQHGPTGDHSHADMAFTTWLDPTLAAMQADAVAKSLADRRPERAATFEENRLALEQDLFDLDRRLAAAAGRLGDAPVLFSHPVYEYLILRYDLNARSLHWEPEEATTRKQWRQLQTLLREHSARILFWESEPLSETARRAADLGVTSIVFAPCGNRCGDDWLATMRGNAERLEWAVRRSP